MTRKSSPQNLVNVSKIEELMELMKKHKLDIIQAETGAEKICLAKNVNSLNFLEKREAVVSEHQNQTQNSVSENSVQANRASAPTETEKKPAEDDSKKVPDGHIITSPFVGTFYRAPSPDSPTFVELGTQVKKGQSLCIVEAMKLMNEIDSDVDGKIVAILHDNGKPVEFGTPLFVVAQS